MEEIRRFLDEADSQYITYQICSALQYMHAMDIAHDLKPENVLLTNTGPPIVKIADFSLAKAVDGGLTMLRTIGGTPNYLAPEVLKQVNKTAGYDYLVDSWSVGVIVFSMLTAATPFGGTKNENQPDTLEYAVNWSMLFDFDITGEEVLDFIDRLLQPDPLYRMSMDEALTHPWLKRE